MVFPRGRLRRNQAGAGPGGVYRLPGFRIVFSQEIVHHGSRVKGIGKGQDLCILVRQLFHSLGYHTGGEFVGAIVVGYGIHNGINRFVVGIASVRHSRNIFRNGIGVNTGTGVLNCTKADRCGRSCKG